MIEQFIALVKEINKIDAENQRTEDFDASLKLLNDLYYSVTEEEYENFMNIITAASDADFRCPK